MKRILFTLMTLILSFVMNAQNYNPFVNQGIISPSPLNNVASNGTGQAAFNVGNSGDDPMPVVVGSEITLTIVLSGGVPNNVNPLAAMSGTFAGYFNWTYNSGTYTGIQNQTIPEALNGGIGDIIIQYNVTSNSVQASPQNGLMATINPAAYAVFNTVGDDQVSSYTWTVAPACQAGNVAPTTH